MTLKTITTAGSQRTQYPSEEALSSPQRRPPAHPPSTSTISDNSNRCCIGKIWDGICRFFAWLCPCLFGPTPPALHPAAQAAKTFVNTHYTDMIKVYSRNTPIPPIEAFKTLKEDVQWHVLLELMTHTPPLPLKFIYSYLIINSSISQEVRTGIDLRRMKQLITRDQGEIKRLSGLLTAFLQHKTLGIQAASLSDSKPPAPQLQDEEVDPPTEESSYPPHSKPHDLGLGFQDDEKPFQPDDSKPFQKPLHPAASKGPLPSSILQGDLVDTVLVELENDPLSTGKWQGLFRDQCNPTTQKAILLDLLDKEYSMGIVYFCLMHLLSSQVIIGDFLDALHIDNLRKITEDTTGKYKPLIKQFFNKKE